MSGAVRPRRPTAASPPERDAVGALVDYLRSEGRRVPAREAAERFGVSTRTVRAWVSRANALQPGLVDSTHHGYALDPGLSLPAVGGRTPGTPSRPLERLYYLVQRLLGTSEAVDVFALAESLHVSVPTLETDLARARALFSQFGLVVTRRGDLLTIEGTEEDRRRLLRQILYETTLPDGLLDAPLLHERFPRYEVDDLRRALADITGKVGLTVNDYVLGGVLLHVVVAVDRTRNGHALDPPGTEPPPDAQSDEAAALLAAYVADTYGVDLSAAETARIRLLLAARTTQADTSDVDAVSRLAGAREVAFVRSRVERLHQEYGIDVSGEGFVAVLALHLHNLLRRASSQAPAHNPLGDRIRETHPLIYELAVFLAVEIWTEYDVELDDGEIAFLAFHLGSYLQSEMTAAQRVRVAVAVPDYHDMRTRAVRAVRDRLGSLADVVAAGPGGLPDADVVVAVRGVAAGKSGELVLVAPLLAPSDLDAVAAAVDRARRRRDADRRRAHLARLLDPGLFWRWEGRPTTRDEALSFVADRAVSAGIAPPSFLAEMREREAASPVSFPSGVAIPHTLRMNAKRSGMAVLVTPTPIDWLGQPVQLVVCVAFNPAERGIFGEVFNDTIRVLTEERHVHRLVAAGGTYESFLAELTALLG